MNKIREIKELPERLFVVGDIHGCPEELHALLKHLREKEQLGPADGLVFMGDYVDRGPDSRTVLEILLGVQQDFPGTIFLRGNHEDMLLEYLGYEGRMGSSYLMNGGTQFLLSYNLSPYMSGEEVLAQLPARHVGFLLNLDRIVILGNYAFVHAGLNPLRPLEAQLDEDIFWIRDEFIENYHQFGKTVVFGHTPYQNVMFHLPYKIGVDTGLVFGNMLSCIELMKGDIFQVARRDTRVRRTSFKSYGIKNYQKPALIAEDVPEVRPQPDETEDR